MPASEDPTSPDPQLRDGAEAVRLAESYAESGDAGAEGEAGVDAAYLTLTPSAVFAHGRLTATRTVAREGMVTTLTVTVRRTRTGRVITALERSFFDPVPLEDEALP